MPAAAKLETGAGNPERQLNLPQPQLQASDLRRIVREASQALAFLDVLRLEELAASCQKLISDSARPASSPALAVEVRQAAPEMAVFARVLEATRANLDVMRRLRALRQGSLEYNPTRQGESGHGDD
ncbi:hypothetical protein DYQ86_01855 [Acidobacteria bacterium AB60]|nr:hypothetical protein DYQ86_01855 [Acidobacteria bacterium AB60]